MTTQAAERGLAAVTKPKKKRAYHHGDLSRALVDAALLRIEKDGPEAFTLRDAARAAGVTHAAAYRHFADKNALVAAIAVEGSQALTAEMRAADGEHPAAVERLRAIGRAYVRFALRWPARFRVMFGANLSRGGQHPEVDTAFAIAVGVIYEVVVDGMERGIFQRDIAVDRTIALSSIAVG